MLFISYASHDRDQVIIYYSCLKQDNARKISPANEKHIYLQTKKQELIPEKRAHLKLLKTYIHPFMKFSSHGTKVHRLFNDFIIILNLVIVAKFISMVHEERK